MLCEGCTFACLLLWRGIDDAVSYTSENDCLLIALAVSHGAHRVVAQAIEALREGCVLDTDPSLLIEQEEVNVVEEGGAEALADLVVATAHDEKGLVRL